VASTIAELAATVTEGLAFGHAFGLRIGDTRIDVRTNNGPLSAELLDYFGPWATDPDEDPHLTIRAAVREPPTLDLAYRDWRGESGEGVKESFANVEDGRVLRKVRSGLQFLLGDRLGVVFGPDLGTRQVVRFINLQYESWCMAHGSVLCHAAGVTRPGGGVAIAARSGAGKSTTALRVMSADEQMAFVSNDRLLLNRTPGGSVVMRGVPKHPRINPGTALNNSDLADVLPFERREILEVMERDELWELDEKHEVRIDRIYGRHRMSSEAALRALFLLTWSHKNQGPVQIAETDLREHQDLLGPLMKPHGPYHLPCDGPPRTGTEPPEPGPYLDVLDGIPTFLVAGGLDFERAVSEVREFTDRFD